MKIIVIPDIHNLGIVGAEIVIAKEKPDLVIFLGDYFDSYGDERDPSLPANTAKWLNTSVQKPNRIHLIGNHDIFYMTGFPGVMCSGNSEHKRYIINTFMKNWDKLYTYAWAGDYLCTHAGLTKPVYDAISNDIGKREIGKVLDHIGAKLTVGKNQSVNPTLRMVGIYRGGHSDHGGILWCHFPDEFTPIKTVKQIFGHTADDEPRSIGDNHCIDTFGEYYAVIEDNKLSIKRKDDQ